MSGPAQVNVQLYVELADAGWTDGDLRRVHAAHELMQSLVSGQRHACGKPFIAHLVGTASVLAAAGAAPDLVLAGLAHAAYSHGDFGWGRRDRPTPHARRVLAEGVGEAVEGLVHAYWRLRFVPAVAAELTASARRGELDDDTRRLVLLRVANDIDNRAFRSELYRSRPDALASGDEVVALGEAAGYPGLAARLSGVLVDERAHVAPAALGPAGDLLAPPRSWRMRSLPRVGRALEFRYHALRKRLDRR